MSESRRRRKIRVSGDSEDLSESSYDDLEIIKRSEEDIDLNVSSEGPRESEYETVDRLEGEEAVDSASDNEGSQDEREEGELSDSVIIEYEREEGDGQESVPPKEKKLDDDEDRRNPQYIPKRGTFYEHDDRTAEDVALETPEKEAERSKEGQSTDKRKVWKEHENRWDHDRYKDDDQAPKSRDELIAIYGYDIRNEEGPPRARRRRRYGRGPNKYTRNWEDEDAYNKTVPPPPTRGSRRGRGGRRGSSSGQPDSEEEFPPLAGSGAPPLSRTVEVTVNEPENLVVQSVTYSNRVADRRIRGERQAPSEAFPPLTSSEHCTQDASRGNESYTPKEDRHLNNIAGNAWKKDGNQNRVEREEGSRSIPGTLAMKGSNNGRNRNQGDERREQDHGEERWKYNHSQAYEQEPPMEGSWRGGRGRYRGGHSDNQVPTSSGVPLVRGRGGMRGRGRTARGAARRSVSETRLSSQDEGSGSEAVNYQVNNQSGNKMHEKNVTNDMSRMSLNDQPQQQGSNRDYHRRQNKNNGNFHQGSERRQAEVPPRMQESAANRPKRYSSLRQRPMPDAARPYAQPHPANFYPQGFVPQPVYGESPAQPPQAVVQATPTTPPLQMLPPHAQGAAYAAAFIRPGVPPPPRMLPPVAQPYITAPAPGPAIINYVAPPPQAQFPPQPYPQFQSFAAVAAPPPTELYQPQGGITYYNPEEQPMTRAIQKRQRAAIPIVPPPEKAPRDQVRDEPLDSSEGPTPEMSPEPQLKIEAPTSLPPKLPQEVEVRSDELIKSNDCALELQNGVLPSVATNGVPEQDIQA